MPGKYSIKDLEALTGIKAHTLRIWEQRYNIVNPQRTDTNIRYYTDEDLKRLLNVSLLNENGIKISHIAKMSFELMCAEVHKCCGLSDNKCEQINGLITSMIEMDELCFERILTNAFLKRGFVNAFSEVVAPLLIKVSVLWQTNSVNTAQKHFVSNLIRQKIIAAIDAQTQLPSINAKKYLLFLPENEMHEISLLAFSYVIRSKGHISIYLGQSISFLSLKDVIEIKKPDVILSVFTQAISNDTFTPYIHKLADTFTSQKIILSGAQFAEKIEKYPKNVSICPSLKEFVALVG